MDANDKIQEYQIRKDWVLTERKTKRKTKRKTAKNARGFIQRQIKKHIEDGMEQKRAVAAAYSEAKKRLQSSKEKKAITTLR